MARTIDYWYNQIIAAKNSKPELDQLNTTSKVAVYNLLAYIVAVVITSLENLFDAHKKEVNDTISILKPHSVQWYREKALKFQFGQNLIPDTDQYDNTGLTDQQVLALQIIKQAAVTEIDGKVRIKVATEIVGELAPLNVGQQSAFKDYIQKVKDAGVKIIDDSLPADSLKLQIDIFYNPLVLRSDGSRIDGNDIDPVKKALKAYLRELPFNGEYANSKLVDKLQLVDGVVYPAIKNAQAKYGLFPFTVIDEKYIPDAGYLRVADVDLILNYREYVQS